MNIRAHDLLTLGDGDFDEIKSGVHDPHIIFL